MLFTKWSHATGEHDARETTQPTKTNHRNETLPPNALAVAAACRRRRRRVSHPNRNHPLPLSMVGCRSLPLTASVDIADSRLFHMRLRRLSQYYSNVFFFFLFFVCFSHCLYMCLHIIPLRAIVAAALLRTPTKYAPFNECLHRRLPFLRLSKNIHQCIDLGVRRYGMWNYCQRRERGKWFVTTSLFRLPSLLLYSYFDFETYYL